MLDKLMKGSMIFLVVMGAGLAMLWITASYQNQELAMGQTAHWLQRAE
jgi:hypothetical protein